MQITRVKARPHPGQAAVHEHPARFKVLAAGRRWGKTRLGVNECLHTASAGGRAWWIAPNYQTAAVGWRPIRRIASQIGAEVRRGDRQILLPNGGEIRVRSADNPDSLRGESLDFVVLDECAFMKEETWTEAIRPALSDRQGRAMFISTPKGRNWFWRLYQVGQQDGDEWQSWRLPTADNPYIAQSEIEAARESLPALTFEQEYLAEFLESNGTVFRNIVANLYTPGHGDHTSHHIVAGVDWGKQNDYTAISVVCADCMQELHLERMREIDYRVQRQRLAHVWQMFNIDDIAAESNSMGEPIIEQLQYDGLPVRGFQTTASSKPQIVESLALALEREEIRWIDDPTATAELEAYERIVSKTTGRSQYSAPAGMHDDTVMARGMALWAMNNMAWVAI